MIHTPEPQPTSSTDIPFSKSRASRTLRDIFLRRRIVEKDVTKMTVKYFYPSNNSLNAKCCCSREIEVSKGD
jgi:hypothetical protein